MKFDGRLPDDRVNLSPGHPLSEAALLVLGVALIAALVSMIVVLVVDRVAMYLPARFEPTIFGPFIAWVGPAHASSHSGDAIQIQALVDRLTGHWKDAPFELRIQVMEDAQVNAMAVPGGVILVTTALLEHVKSENELAFVLGHEIGHFRHRDHIRRLGRELALAALLAPLAGQGGGDLAALAGKVAARRFDRTQESDADRFGLELVQREYGHVAAATAFFDHLTESTDARVQRFASYLSTHPGHADRSRALEALARERGWALEGTLTPLWNDAGGSDAKRSDPKEVSEPSADR